MMTSDDARLDAVFQALSDGTRRAMLRQLAAGQRSISELGAPFSISFAGASKHVKVLERAGLVSRIVQGRTHYCRLESAALATADAWLRYYEQFWNSSLERLEQQLRHDTPPQ